MFDLSFSEMLVIAVVAVVAIGPKELPGALATLGRWMGQAKAVARNFRSSFDAMVREAELKELEQQWADQNERIMAEHPAVAVTDEDSSGAKGAQLPTSSGPVSPIRDESGR